MFLHKLPNQWKSIIKYQTKLTIIPEERRKLVKEKQTINYKCLKNNCSIGLVLAKRSIKMVDRGYFYTKSMVLNNRIVVSNILNPFCNRITRIRNKKRESTLIVRTYHSNSLNLIWTKVNPLTDKKKSCIEQKKAAIIY